MAKTPKQVLKAAFTERSARDAAEKAEADRIKKVQKALQAAVAPALKVMQAIKEASAKALGGSDLLVYAKDEGSSETLVYYAHTRKYVGAENLREQSRVNREIFRIQVDARMLDSKGRIAANILATDSVLSQFQDFLSTVYTAEQLAAIQKAMQPQKPSLPPKDKFKQ